MQISALKWLTINLRTTSKKESVFSLRQTEGSIFVRKWHHHCNGKINHSLFPHFIYTSMQRVERHSQTLPLWQGIKLGLSACQTAKVKTLVKFM